jgi:6-phosphogluconolactonase
VTTAVYVSNADSGSVSVLALDEERGTLATLQTLDLGGTLMPMALSPDRRRLFVARRSEPLAAITLGIDSATGTLALVGEAPLPASMAFIATDATGRWLLSASYPEHVVAVSRIGDDGIVLPAHQVQRTGQHAHAIRCDASNRYAFSTSLGADAVHQWRFDERTGLLRENEAAHCLRLRPGAGPRHLEFHPNGRWVYLLNELDATLDVLALDAPIGVLAPSRTRATLPDGFSGKPWAADLHLRPDGRFLYTSERTSSTLAGFAVEDDGARLQPIGHWPAPACPRGFQVTASGRWLVAAGQLAHRVALYAIDDAAGRLVPHGEHEVGLNPNWVETLALA